MPSNLNFIDYVCARIQELGNVRYRKMFGDYMIYLDEKPVILVCDNLAYVKKHPAIVGLMKEAETGIPYPGAKEHYILDVDHADNLLRVVGLLREVLPYPEKKNRKAKDTLTGKACSLREIPNVGRQTEQDLLAMGYTSIESLKGKKADELYAEECRLRGFVVDRCQLYLYRALEYYVNAKYPDIEKCRWWLWKDEFVEPSPCGAACIACEKFPGTCKGCRAIRGKVFWLSYTGGDVCPIYQCCKDRKKKNCGGCQELPCHRFVKDPTVSDAENEANLKLMLERLNHSL